MQKLKQRTKHTHRPTDASLIRRNSGLSLNKEETLSVASSKTRFNNPEVNQRPHTGGLKDKVYVLSINNNPLMPCTSAKARRLLKNKRAKIVKMYPFAIRLNFECENKTQNVTMGIDSGYGNIGFSCITEKEELISGTIVLDDKTSNRLTERAMYRRGRRSRHHWYRQSRFLNRTKPEGWLPPSTQRRYDTHLNLIRRLKAIIPITQVVIETANFDIAKIENPEISGTGYQQGDMYGYQNMRSYLMAREHGLCQLCSKIFSKGNPSHIHHCKQRNEAGSSRAKNLALVHEKCHIKLHKKGLKLKSAKEYKPNIFMSIIRKKFWQDIPNLKVTYGYITFLKRQENNIPKSHNNDAFVIAGGTTQKRCVPVEIKQKHRNNRAIQLNRNGFKPSIRRQRYKIQPLDIIWIDGKRKIVSGCHNHGNSVVLASKKDIGIKYVEKIYNFGSLAWAI